MFVRVTVGHAVIQGVTLNCGELGAVEVMLALLNLVLEYNIKALIVHMGVDS